MGKLLKYSLLKLILSLTYLFSTVSYTQTIFNFEYLVGKTSAANSYFPNLDLSQSVSISIGKKIVDPELNWAQNLNNPIVGLNVEYIYFGNNTILGAAYSFQPFIEMPLLKNSIKNLNIQTALGFSYLTKNTTKLIIGRIKLSQPI